MVLDKNQIEDFKSKGYFIAKGLFTEEELASVTPELDGLVEGIMARSKESGQKNLENSWIRLGFAFCAKLHRESDKVRKFAGHPKLAQAANELFGTDIRLYWDQAVYKHPRVGAFFPWHQDSGYGHPVPEEYVTCWVALDDTDSENGGVWILPGSHKKGIFPHTDDGEGHLVGYEGPEKGQCVPIKRGEVLIFSSLVLHSTGPNHTDRKRRAYVLQYCDASTVRIGDDEDSAFRVMPMVFQNGAPIELIVN